MESSPEIRKERRGLSEDVIGGMVEWENNIPKQPFGKAKKKLMNVCL
jgi:hypothetical protein